MTEPATDPQPYRPDSYWNPGLMVIANIKGDIRQANVLEGYNDGCLERLPDWFFAESLKPEKLEEAVSQSPSWAGGESLPDYLEDEVEIARLTLHPGRRDVIAIRARPLGDEIAYRLVSEWEPVEPCELTTSALPLTYQELVDLFEGICLERYPLIMRWWMLVGAREGMIAAVASLKVTSLFYPGLTDWYHAIACDTATTLLELYNGVQANQPSLFGGPGTPAKALSPLHVAAIRGDAEKTAQLLGEGHNADELVDPMIRCVIEQVPTFGFNRPLVRRIYDEIGFDIVKIRSGMNARDLALAGEHAEVAALLQTAERSTR